MIDDDGNKINKETGRVDKMGEQHNQGNVTEGIIKLTSQCQHSLHPSSCSTRTYIMVCARLSWGVSGEVLFQFPNNIITIEIRSTINIIQTEEETRNHSHIGQAFQSVDQLCRIETNLISMRMDHIAYSFMY